MQDNIELRQFVSFFLFAGIMLFILYGYTGFRFVQTVRLPGTAQAVFWPLVILCAVLPLVSIFLRFRDGHDFIVTYSAWIGYTVLGFTSILFMFFTARDLAWGVFRIGSWLYHLAAPMQATSAQLAAASAGRAAFMSGSTWALCLLTLGLTLYGLVEARRTARVKEVPISLPALSSGLNGFRIVQISDIHVGPTVREAYLRSIVDRVNGLHPDMIVLTGDLVDGTVDDLRDDVAPVADLNAPYGKFFITGNHEYYSGVLSWIDEIERLGFTALINEHTIVSVGNSRIIVAGVTDYHAGGLLPPHRSSPKTALDGAPEDIPRIMLAHQPLSAFKAADEGVDLLICGHTHGGQYFPWNMIVNSVQPFVRGLHRYRDMIIYVSVGTGYWGPPLRIGEPSEITVFTLQRGVPD